MNSLPCYSQKPKKIGEDGFLVGGRCKLEIGLCWDRSHDTNILWIFHLQFPFHNNFCWQILKVFWNNMFDLLYNNISFIVNIAKHLRSSRNHKGPPHSLEAFTWPPSTTLKLWNPPKFTRKQLTMFLTKREDPKLPKRPLENQIQPGLTKVLQRSWNHSKRIKHNRQNMKKPIKHKRNTAPSAARQVLQAQGSPMARASRTGASGGLRCAPGEPKRNGAKESGRKRFICFLYFFSFFLAFFFPLVSFCFIFPFFFLVFYSCFSFFWVLSYFL